MDFKKIGMEMRGYLLTSWYGARAFTMAKKSTCRHIAYTVFNSHLQVGVKLKVEGL